MFVATNITYLCSGLARRVDRRKITVEEKGGIRHTYQINKEGLVAIWTKSRKKGTLMTGSGSPRPSSCCPVRIRTGTDV